MKTLIDTSVIVAWLDVSHEHHAACEKCILKVPDGLLAASVVTLAELAAGGRSREAIENDLRDFEIVDLDANDCLRAGQAFARFPKSNRNQPVLPDFLIRAQAAIREWKHLTNDDRRLAPWPGVDFEFVRPRRS